MDKPPRRPPIVVNAIIAAVIMTLLSLLSAVFNDPVIAIPQAVVGAIAVIGLLRGNRWAGYGYALFLSCSTAAAMFSSFYIGSLPKPYWLVGAIIPLTVAAFAFLAGNALSIRGHPFPWLIVSAIPLALSFFFNLLFMPTGSMEPTLLSGDSVVVRRTSAASIGRGDLVVYREPDKHNIWVKRVVGVGGDRIRLDHKNLTLNGRPVREPYTVHTTRYFDEYRDNFPLGDFHVPLSTKMQEQLTNQVKDGDFVVPAGTFFLLGDNRDNSLDSRYTGVVPASAIIGRPWMVCFSAELPNQFLSAQPEPHNVLARARWKRVLKPL